MKPSTSFANFIFDKLKSYRILLLVVTSLVGGLLGYIIIKFPGHNDIHATAELYANGALSQWKVEQWNWPPFLSGLTFVQLTYVELLIDTLVFIPIYSMALWVWAGYYAHKRPIINQRNLLTKILNWLWPYLPIMICIAAVADLVENCYLALWINHGYPPVSVWKMKFIRALKFWPISLIVVYILLGLGMSKVFRSFISEIWKNTWYVFKCVTINKYIRCGVIMLRTVWPTVLILVITYIFLNLMDQARDLLDSLVNDPKYSVCVFICLLLYTLIVWYSTRIIFILKDQRLVVEYIDSTDKYEQAPADQLRSETSKVENLDYEELQVLVDFRKKNDIWIKSIPYYSAIDLGTLRTFTRWTPVLLGLIPFMALMKALSNLMDTSWHQIALVIEIFIYLAIASQVNNYVDGPSADDCNIHPHTINNLLPIHKRVLQIALFGCILLIGLASIWRTNLAISRFFGPVSIVFLALSMWAIFASFFTYLDYKYKAPFTLICLLIMMFLNNNNHQIRTLSSKTGVGSYFSKDTATQRVPAYFANWLNSLITEADTNKPIPVYFISTEGGGIRSAYWTATALKQLDSLNPNFFRHVFAISGVSGGSVGATVFTAQYRDRLLKPTMRFNIDRFFQRDYLSPLLTAMLIPDMLQKFSPVAINSVDRAQYLEDGWADAYHDASVQSFDPDSIQVRNSNSETPEDLELSWVKVPDSVYLDTFNQSFLSLWSIDSIRYKLPVLFLNATQAETGRKGIITPLVINGDNQFQNVIDIQEEVYRHIPLKTAASISARFPIVTPPATVRVINEPASDASNFVDGGYLDNSGTTTLLSILSSINSDAKLVKTLRRYRVQFRIVSINNSVETDPNQQVRSLTGLYELKAPLLAFFESWDNSGDYRRYAVKEYARGFSSITTKVADSGSKDKGEPIIDPNLYNINLNRKTGVIPLGWDLSQQAEERIREQGRRLYLSLRKNNESTSLLAGLSKLRPSDQPPNGSTKVFTLKKVKSNPSFELNP